MDKQKIYDLKAKKKSQLDAMAALADKDDFDPESESYKAEMKKLDTLNSQIEAAEKLYEQLSGMGLPENPGMKQLGGSESGYDKAVKDMASAARKGFRAEKGMNEGSNADGGYTVPEDVVTRVYKLREAEDSLIDLISMENVTTNKGSRTQQTRGQAQRFSVVGEGQAVGTMATPQFKRINYEITKKGGVLPVTEELLEDSDAAIVNILNTWLARSSANTWSYYILQALNTKTAVDLTDLDGIRKAWLLGLDPAFRSTSCILTNEHGLFYLATLKDEDGHDLLTPDITQPSVMRLAVGPYAVPVRVKSSKILPNVGENIPFYIGDFKEAIHGYDRRMLTLAQSNTAVVGNLNAFEQGLTLIKGTQRDDVQVFDDEAWIHGYINAADIVDSPRLSALSIGSVTLTPAFDPDVTEYTATTANSTNTVTATCEDDDATAVIKNGSTVVTSGSAATWAAGKNTVTVVVSCGSKSKTYTVEVTKS